jgi:hypothetical protein
MIWAAVLVPMQEVAAPAVYHTLADLPVVH